MDIIRKFDYVEIVDIKEENQDIPEEHRILPEERFKKIQEEKTLFRNWD